MEMLSTTDGWAGGTIGRMYHYNGSSWTSTSIAGYGDYINGVSMVSGTDGWAVGDGGRIYDYDGE
ncbi:hypothetical protein KQH61_00415 [bacterium]|nr:hypothetical protein [bacterium]